MRHHRSDAYSAQQVLLNKRQIYGGAPKLHWYQTCPLRLRGEYVARIDRYVSFPFRIAFCRILQSLCRFWLTLVVRDCVIFSFVFVWSWQAATYTFRELIGLIGSIEQRTPAFHVGASHLSDIYVCLRDSQPQLNLLLACRPIAVTQGRWRCPIYTGCDKKCPKDFCVVLWAITWNFKVKFYRPI